MSDMEAFLLVSVGVLVAVIFPVVRGFIKKEFPPTAGAMPPWVRKYGGLFIFSLITALIVFAIFKSQTPEGELTWYAAFLLGFAWEATIEKFTTKAA